MNNLAKLTTLVEQQWHRFGHQTPLDGLLLTRAEKPSGLIHGVYRPSLCVVLQGAKTSTLGGSGFHYRAGQCLIAKINVPVTARIEQASQTEPYLAFSLAFDPVMVAELLIEQGQALPPLASVPALQTASLPEPLIDPLQRLLSLLHQPQDLAVLAPLIQKEVIWRLLNSPFADALRQLGAKDSHMARIGLATAWLREHYNQPIKVAQLAELSNMSVASFHRHFKTVTQLSPVQFQKQIRLQEARRLLLSDHEVATVGYQVGYESPSQFNRDYRRLFGAPPGKDKAFLRSNLALETAG